MKRVLALLLALVMLFCLTACGGDEEGAPTGENAGATTNNVENPKDPTDGTEDNTQDTPDNTVDDAQDNTQSPTGGVTDGNQNSTQGATGNNQSNHQGSTNNTSSGENTTTGNYPSTTPPSTQSSRTYTKIDKVIPAGGAYVFRKNYESIYEGGTIPSSPSVGDYFYYGDYRYEFVCINNKYGWDVYAESLTDGTQYKSSYGKILLSINNFPIIAMSSTFHSNPQLKTAPSIPVTVIDMTQTFHSCTALVSAPKLPEGLLTMAATFADCPALKTYDGVEEGTPDGDFSKYNIPRKVSDSDIVGAFYDCSSIQVLPRNISDSKPTPSTPSPSTPQPVRVSGVQISKTSLSLKVGDTQQLTATVSPSNAENKNTIWSSSNSSIAQVSSTGKITAKGAGSATITVTTVDGNYTAKCTVTVAELPAAEQLSDVLIIRGTYTISNQTIDTDVYITSAGVATFNNVTVKGNIYCYGQLTANGVSANKICTYCYVASWGTGSCDAFDGIHGKITGNVSGNELIVRDYALDDAFDKWGKT